MREFAKSVVSYTWAMSMFGVQQIVNIFAPAERGQGSKAAESFNKLADATTQEMGESMRSTFRAGDKLQRGMVDMMFSGCALGAFDPTRWMRMPSEAMRRTAEATNRAASGNYAGAGQPSSGPRQGFGEAFRPDRSPDPPTAQPGPKNGTAQGWGPMP